jgi:hypothetical protein
MFEGTTNEIAPFAVIAFTDANDFDVPVPVEYKTRNGAVKAARAMLGHEHKAIVLAHNGDGNYTEVLTLVIDRS